MRRQCGYGLRILGSTLLNLIVSNRARNFANTDTRLIPQALIASVDRGMIQHISSSPPQKKSVRGLLSAHLTDGVPKVFSGFSKPKNGQFDMFWYGVGFATRCSLPFKITIRSGRSGGGGTGHRRANIACTVAAVVGPNTIFLRADVVRQAE